MSDPKLDFNFINPFIESVLTTLKTQCHIAATPGKVFWKGEEQDKKISLSIAALIDLTSSIFKGSIALCFPKDTFLKIMSSMLGETYTEITKDIEDGAGELLNIIFGCSKRVLNEKNFNIKRVIPTIVQGDNLTVRTLSKKTSVILPFSSDAGNFQIEIMFDN